jgi:stage III sporulation protein AH
MLFVNFRRLFLTALFILGAGTLLVGYSGVVGMIFKDRAGPERAADRSGLVHGGFRPVTGGELSDRAPDAGPEAAGKEGFFVEYRLQRERARGQQVEILREIINSPSSAGDTRQVAQDQLLGISRSVAKEARVENLLKARGYRDAVVCVDQKGVTVVVESPGLNSPEEARLIELVSRETGFGEQGIIIVPKN